MKREADAMPTLLCTPQTQDDITKDILDSLAAERMANINTLATAIAALRRVD